MSVEFVVVKSGLRNPLCPLNGILKDITWKTQRGVERIGFMLKLMFTALGT
jgi:hypothetical protein